MKLGLLLNTFNSAQATDHAAQSVADVANNNAQQLAEAVNQTTQAATGTATQLAESVVGTAAQVADTASQAGAATADQVDFGMMHLVMGQGDWVLKAAFLTMLVMSVMSWSIIVYRLIGALRIRSRMKRHLNLMNAGGYASYEQLLSNMQGTSPVKHMLSEAMSAGVDFKRSNNPFSKSLNFSDYLMRRIRHALEVNLNAQDGGLTVLASIGATAPFVGLFGTVWGIYHALINIAVMGNVNIATISGPIGEALIATAFGLFVAIPAVLAYNALNRSNRVLNRHLDGFAHDVYNSFLQTEDKE
ncbi:MAG: MotA/TolQ/ExbB proton channel family protein [Alcaligenaceae bacterium]|nr:MotA/TolQ/ExbB proton channel family protein [Alcaligenaceae bacterium]